MVNSMLTESGLSKKLWGEVLLTANAILNKIHFKHIDKTPYELWFNKTPTLKYLKVWGCLAKVKVPEIKKRKLRPKTVDCVFLGYVENNHDNRFLIINSEVPDFRVHTIFETRP